MIKLFIGQPMGKRSAEDIRKTREMAIFYAKNEIKKESDDLVEVLNTYYTKCNHETNPLWFLSKTINQLALADVCYFAEGWEKSRASRIQHQIAVEYGKKIIETK